MSTITVARVNGIALHAADETLTPEELRQRACTELLRQAAQRDGSLAAADAPPGDGAISEAAAAAIDAHIERAVQVPAPSEEACRRYFAAHAREFSAGERLRLRHILFAVTPGVNVAALRQRAEATLVQVRTDAAFDEAARTLSNCPSGRDGGELGFLEASECAPEFARAVFAHAGLGVLPQLVHSRHGFHIVEIVAREGGTTPSFEAVRPAVTAALERQAFVTALRQYLHVLAGAAKLEGVDLEGAATPLVQ